MNGSHIKIGFERKIGYSFLGLVAGNIASLAALLLIAVLPLLDAFTGIRQLWKLDTGESLGWSIAIGIVSMLGWVVIGLPVVLLLRVDVAARLHWLAAALIGLLLGALTMLLLLLALNHGRMDSDSVNREALKMLGGLIADAGLIAGVAFAVYCRLVRVALQRQTKEDGAPSGTPRSLAWFDF